MRTEYPQTVLAIWRNDLAALEQLILERTRVDERDPDGRTPLMAAAIHSSINAAQLLLAAGANPNLQDPNGWSALHFAAQEYSVEVCRALLDAGARPDLQDVHGNTPLFRATFASSGRGDVILLLRERGADPLLPNNSGVSACELARRIANANVAQYFADLPL